MLPVQSIFLDSHTIFRHSNKKKYKICFNFEISIFDCELSTIQRSDFKLESDLLSTGTYNLESGLKSKFSKVGHSVGVLPWFGLRKVATSLKP